MPVLAEQSNHAGDAGHCDYWHLWRGITQRALLTPRGHDASVDYGASWLDDQLGTFMTEGTHILNVIPLSRVGFYALPA